MIQLSVVKKICFDIKSVLKNNQSEFCLSVLFQSSKMNHSFGIVWVLFLLIWSQADSSDDINAIKERVKRKTILHSGVNPITLLEL